MSVLILQIIIKQWDKSQRTEAHVSERANKPDRCPIKIPPAFYVFDKQCVIDQHGDDLQGGRVKYSQTPEGNVRLDRFQIDLNTNVLQYRDTSKTDEETKVIGSLENSWIQCKYSWRYSIFEGEMFYWLYEDITLNATCIKSLDENVFMNSEPAIAYEVP